MTSSAASASGGAQSSSSAAQPPTAATATRFMSPYIRNDFLAQETLIEIFPKFELGRIHFVNGEYGPFSPNYPVAVPLWLALFLRETNTCTIRPPEDLSVQKLTDALEFEDTNAATFFPLPLHFFSVVRQILRYAAADVPDAAVVHRLVEELEQRRAGKITANISALQHAALPPPAFGTGQLTTNELLMMKASLFRVVNDAAALRARAEIRLHRPPQQQQQQQQQQQASQPGTGSSQMTSSHFGGGGGGGGGAATAMRPSQQTTTNVTSDFATGGRTTTNTAQNSMVTGGGDGDDSDVFGLGPVPGGDSQSLMDFSSQGAGGGTTSRNESSMRSRKTLRNK